MARLSRPCLILLANAVPFDVKTLRARYQEMRPGNSESEKAAVDTPDKTIVLATPFPRKGQGSSAVAVH